jgi:outer membrane beta-barrel protein
MKKVFLILISLFSMAAVADESSLYRFSWLDKDKEVYVLQNRKFRKVGTFYVGATGVKTLNGAFINSIGGTGRAGYFFTEDWGLEVAYGKNAGSENDTAKGIREQGTVPFYRKIDTYASAMAMWSPFYSKINTFNKVFYFDWMFGAGLASIKTLDNRNKFDTASQQQNSLTSSSVMGAAWMTGFRFYLTEHWSLRLDFYGLHYQADKTKKQQGAASTTKSSLLFSNYDLGLGLNYSF